MKIKNNLKKIREESGLTQSEVAKKIGICERQYQYIEAETPKSVERFRNLAKLYSTTIDALLEQGDGE